MNDPHREASNLIKKKNARKIEAWMSFKPLKADNVQSDTTDKSNDTLPMVTFSLHFVDQKAMENTRRQLKSLSTKIGVSLQPVFSNKKVCNFLKTREPKPKTVNKQCVLHCFKCGLCSMDCVSFTNHHLNQCINEHTSSEDLWSRNTKQHWVEEPTITDSFSVLKKCQNKLDCLVVHQADAYLQTSFSRLKL